MLVQVMEPRASGRNAVSAQEEVSAELAAGDTDPPLDDRRIAKTGDRCEIPVCTKRSAATGRES